MSKDPNSGLSSSWLDLSYYTRSSPSSSSSSSSSSTSLIPSSSTSQSMLDSVLGSLPGLPSLPSLWGSSNTVVTRTTSSEPREFVPAGAVSSVNGQGPEEVSTTTTVTTTVTNTNSSSVTGSAIIAGVSVVAVAASAPVSLPLAAGVAVAGAAASAWNYFAGDSSNTTSRTTTDSSANLHEALLAEIRAKKILKKTGALEKLLGTEGANSQGDHDDIDHVGPMGEVEVKE